MQRYLSVKATDAEPMTYGEFCAKKGITLEAGRNPKEKGYGVYYPDQNPPYFSWSPKAPFDRSHFPIKDKSKITEHDINSFITNTESETHKNGKTTLVHVETKTGFEQFAHSSCVDPANYSKKMGTMIGKEEIVSELWYGLGFVLQWANFGLNNSPIKEPKKLVTGTDPAMPDSNEAIDCRVEQENIIPGTTVKEEFKTYLKKSLTLIRDFVPGEDLTHIELGEQPVNPKLGGKICCNMGNLEDKWYITEEYFKENYKEV